jgi:hypothetical protein
MNGRATEESTLKGADAGRRAIGRDTRSSLFDLFDGGAAPVFRAGAPRPIPMLSRFHAATPSGAAPRRTPMDAERFANLCRTVAGASRTRREGMRALVGLAVALAGGAGFASRDAAAGGCRRVGARCDRSADCCNGASCRGNTCRCRAGFVEDGSRCRQATPPRFCGVGCWRGQICCDGVCVDATRNTDHCGACGRQCGFREWCDGGACACEDHTGRCQRVVNPGTPEETRLPGVCCPIECACDAATGGCSC